MDSGLEVDLAQNGIGQKMYSNQQLLDSIHRAAPIAIGVVADRPILVVNPQMCTMTGYGEDELIGKSARMLYASQKEFERVGKEKYAMMAEMGLGTVETQWVTKDGRFIDILLSSAPTDGRDAGKGATFTATDISLQKEAQRETSKIIESLGSIIADRTQWLNENNLRLEEEIKKRIGTEERLRSSKAELEKTVEQLRATQAQIIQTEKMASIGQLAAGVAHEINNPTAFVSSNLGTMARYQVDLIRLVEAYEQVLSGLAENSESAQYTESVSTAVQQIRELAEELDLEFVKEDFPELIEESQEGTERIKKIVADLKDFAHPGDERSIETDINQGLDSTINIVWNELKYNSTLEKDYASLPPVLCYTQQINQVFMNILINASQAIERDGLIKVSTRHEDGQVLVQISDNGCGIPENIQSQIFDPFFTTKDIGKGTGLGLSMSYSIIEKHNGRIEVESKVGEGTTFTIYLPTAQAKQPDATSSL